MLYRDIEADLAYKVLNPFNWLRLLSPYFSRIDLASELYGDLIFSHKTYLDLLDNRHRPFVMLNSTDLTTGDDFEFTQDQFDLIGSDIRSFPLARAVAASSAFPFLLSPVSLVNHPEPAGYAAPPSLAEGANDYYVNRRRFTWVENQANYLKKASNPYIHVMDGGLADNIGLRAVLRELWDPTGFISRRLNRGKISKLVLIAVNAKNGGPQTLNKNESPPSLIDVAFKTATVAMDNYSFETIELARDQQRTLDQAQRDLARCKRIAKSPDTDCPTFATPFEVHVIDVNLDAIKDPARRGRLLSIGTNFSLTHAEVDMLIGAAGEVLDQNPDFQKLLKELH